MKRRILLAMFAFILIVPASIVSAEEVKEEAGQTVVVPSVAATPQRKDAVHEEMQQKEHRHDEGMHGMMGHHSTGWAIMIGVVMVVMIAAMVL